MPSTTFTAIKNGFHFTNDFTNHLVKALPSLKTEGLCGGMSFAALDYFFNGLPIPPHKTEDFPFSSGIPPETSRFYNYLFDRQIDSFKTSTMPKFLQWHKDSDASVQSQTRTIEIPNLRTQIDKGKPIVLGLVTTSSSVMDVVNSHQVVAYGYDINPSSGVVTIQIYDNNYPDNELTLTVNPTPSPVIESTPSGKQWKGFFVQAYSPKLPTFMGSKDEIWSDDWSLDWTSFLPFKLVPNGLQYYLAYKVNSGQVSIDRIKQNGHGVETIWGGPAGTWSNGWTSFVPFQLNGQPHYLAYKVDSGQVTIDRIRPDGKGVDTIWGGSAGTWSNGWTSFMPFKLNGQPHYLAYKVNSGEVAIDRIRPDGKGVDTIWSGPAGTWSNGWTSFVPFERNGQPHYLAYKVDSGEVAIDRIRLDGKGVDTIWSGPAGTWTKNWTSFMPFELNGQLFYFGYKKKDGQMTFGIYPS